MEYKKVYTWDQIKNDPRISEAIRDYDGKGKHHVECVDGFGFDNERSIDIGTVSELCYSINNNLGPYKHK